MKLIPMAVLTAAMVVSAFALAAGSKKPGARMEPRAPTVAPTVAPAGESAAEDATVVPVETDDGAPVEDDGTVVADEDGSAVADVDDDDPSADDAYADGQPPADRYEDPGDPPCDDDVFVPGSFRHRKGLYVWTRGVWVPGRAGYDHVPTRWVEVNGRWVSVGGTWAPRSTGSATTPPRSYQPAHPSASESPPKNGSHVTPMKLDGQPAGLRSDVPPVQTTHRPRAPYGEGDPVAGDRSGRSSYGEGDPRHGDLLGSVQREPASRSDRPEVQPRQVPLRPAVEWSRVALPRAAPGQGAPAYHAMPHHGGGRR